MLLYLKDMESEYLLLMDVQLIVTVMTKMLTAKILK